ncbi:hypothetical protein [Actinoplanes lobatus]|uniref:Uncharacterized protein n=2 Tax=Actinoplanes lobatus TaxID=113568 RepID=A0A7W7HEK5_9ACTN|nr:hypothetical protein [Actinoplanes lobatus]MBB4749112.1 hypothetical protein [Actinoplanes lobatus]
MLLAAAPAAGTDEGFGWLIAMLIAALVAVLAIGGHQAWMDQHGPSPTPPWARRSRVTPGETREPDPDDTDFDTEDEPDEWGPPWARRIRMADGSVLVRGQSHADQGDEEEPDADEEQEETREEMADRLIRIRCRYSDAVREIMAAFDVSESTAKRAIAAAQERAGGR